MSNFKSAIIPYTGKKDFIRELACIMPGTWGHSCGEGVDPAHYTTGSFAGANLKNDRRILPLCRVHHSQQHSLGELRFWGDTFIDARELADFLHIIYMESLLYPEHKDFLIEQAHEQCRRFMI